MRYINLKGKEYPILFDLNVIEEVQKRYGDIEEITDKIKDISEAKWILSLLINEGLAYDNYINNKSNRELTVREVGMLFTAKELTDGVISQTIINAFNDSVGDEKKVTAEQLTEIVMQ